MTHTLYSGSSVDWQLVISGLETAIIERSRPVRLPDDDDPNGWSIALVSPPDAPTLRHAIAIIAKSVTPGCPTNCSLPDHPDITRLARAYLTPVPIPSRHTSPFTASW